MRRRLQCAREDHFRPRGRSASIGFGVKVLAPEDRKAGQIFREVEPEDLLKYRLIPEFVGRLPMVATFEDLDEPSLKLILTQPKKTLVKHDQRLCEMGALIHPATLVASFRWCLGDSQVRRCFVRCGQVGRAIGDDRPRREHGTHASRTSRRIKDPDRNGGRDLAPLHEHLAHDDLVAWGWQPGEGRDSAPGSQAMLGELIQAWIDTGAECP